MPGDEPMLAAKLRSIDAIDLYADGWRHTGDVYRHPEYGVMWPAWDGWRAVAHGGREVGPCGTAMEVAERLTRGAVCGRP